MLCTLESLLIFSHQKRLTKPTVLFKKKLIFMRIRLSVGKQWLMAFNRHSAAGFMDYRYS